MNARVVTVAAERLPGWLTGFTERHGATTASVNPALTEVALVGADDARAWLTVPFPPLNGVRADPREALLAHVARPRTVGVLLVRRGGHAVGVFVGAKLIASKVGSNYVQGTTKAGGWSQQRFARRRANQARVAFAGAADAAVRVLLPHVVSEGVASLEALVCGGDRVAVREVLADPRVTALAALVRHPFLAGPDPRLRVLLATPDQFRAVSIRLDP